MDEFLEFLRGMMDESKLKIKGANISGTMYALGVNDETPQEAKEGFLAQVKESGYEGDIRYLDYASEVDGGDKDSFNEKLAAITEKHDLNPDQFGIDHNDFGFIFAWKGGEPYQVEDAQTDLVTLVASLKGKQRAIIMTSESEQHVFETDGEGGYKELYVEEPVAKVESVTRTEPINRKPISDSEVMDLKIALNQDDKRDCLDVLEDIMRIGN